MTPGNPRLVLNAGPKAREHCIGAGDRGFENGLIRRLQVGFHGTHAFIGQLGRIAYDRGDVMTCHDRLIEHLPTDAARRCEKL